MLKIGVLVTGHTGFIGRAFVRLLDQHGIPWFGASKSTGHDLEQPATLSDFPEVDWVVHLAGIAGVRRSWEEPGLFHRVNVGTALTALEAARRRNARFLLVSSYMYGIPSRLPVDEDHPLAWNNPYSASKRMVEVLCQTYADNFELPLVTLRPFNLFGPQQSTEFLVSYVIHQAQNSDTIAVEDLSPRRDYLWVGDLAEALLAVVRKNESPHQTFNIGSGRSVSVGDVVQTVMRVSGPRRVVSQDNPRPNEIPDCVCDNRRFVETFGWHPSVSLEEGVRRLMKKEDRGIFRVA